MAGEGKAQKKKKKHQKKKHRLYIQNCYTYKAITQTVGIVVRGNPDIRLGGVSLFVSVVTAAAAVALWARRKIKKKKTHAVLYIIHDLCVCI